jgi:hypothetical protein
MDWASVGVCHLIRYRHLLVGIQTRSRRKKEPRDILGLKKLYGQILALGILVVGEILERAFAVGIHEVLSQTPAQRS